VRPVFVEGLDGSQVQIETFTATVTENADPLRFNRRSQPGLVHGDGLQLGRGN
jgi:hypothetical protein